ncbi:MAG: helix-turn-helix domain-containing protein [Bacteroidetes bacterium]|nr:helix-turn-helix domain-containing protein [Bacteroidota bacterium]
MNISTPDSQSGRLKELLFRLNLNQQAFAEKLDISQSAVSQVLRDKTKLSFDTLQKIAEVYEVNLNWLVAGQGSMFPQAAAAAPPGGILAVTVDSQDDPNIVLVPVKAQAGYVSQRLEPTYLQQLPAFSLPMERFRQGTYRGFEVAGDSMEPTLFQGDLLICSYVEQVNYLRDMHLYIFVTPGDVLVKRPRNLLRSHGYMELLSDNDFYPPIQLAPEDLQEVWQVYARLTLNFRAPGSGQ